MPPSGACSSRKGREQPAVPAARRPHQRDDSHRRRRDRSRRTDHGHRGPLNEERPMRTETRTISDFAGKHDEPLRFDVLVVGLGPSAPRWPTCSARYGVTRAGDRPGHRNLHEAPGDRARQRGAAHPADGRRARGRVRHHRASRRCSTARRCSAASPASTRRRDRRPPGARDLLPARAGDSAARASWRRRRRPACCRAPRWKPSRTTARASRRG